MWQKLILDLNFQKNQITRILSILQAAQQTFLVKNVSYKSAYASYTQGIYTNYTVCFSVYSFE
jgi:hypothetical protein